MRALLAVIVSFGVAFSAQAEIARADARGGMRAKVVVTDNANKLQAMAAKQDKTPILRNKQAIRPRQSLHVATLVSGLTADKNGRYDASVSYRVHDPDSQVIVEQEAFAVATGKMLDRDAFVMALPAYTFELEQRAPRGAYFVEAIVLDKNSGLKALSRQRLILE